MTRFGLILSAMMLPLLAHAQSDPFAPAKNNEPRIWSALSGELMLLEGELVWLRGVVCPSVKTDTGRRAKALLNTFLRGGNITCHVHPGGMADCTKEGRDFASGMARSGLCRFDLARFGDHALPPVGRTDPSGAAIGPAELRQLGVHKGVRCLELELLDGTEVTLCLPHEKMRQ